MKVCFAVEENDGMESTVYNHFGSAPEFVVVDTELKKTVTIKNRDIQHAHGACNPVAAIGGHQIDAVIVGGIGAGALMKLNEEGIRVFRSVANTIKDNLVLLTEKKLPEMTVRQTCGGHQGKCGH
ncbi:MAG: diguanylate cyclase [Proteobacteria bacterium]|nr:diguanylate cyclase [Pseudomonadota bacterium]